MAACHMYKTITKSLSEAKDEEQAVTMLKSPIDAVAVAVHSWALHAGLRFEGLTENAPSNSGFTLDDLKVLDSSWQEGSPNYFFFRYSKNKLPLDLTITKLGASTALVSATYGGKDAIAKLDTTEYTNQSFFQRPDGSEEARDAYVSDMKVEALCETLTTGILRKLMPTDDTKNNAITPEKQAGSSLQEPTDDYSRASTPQQQPNSRPFMPNVPNNPPVAASREHVPLRDPMMPPGFEDEYEFQAGPRGGNAQRGGFGPNIGDNDLYPPGIGPTPPMQPHIGPGRGAGGVGGGMTPSMDDPFFSQGGDRGGNRDGHDDLQRPPGSRWDPTGPGSNRNRGGGFGPGFGPGFI